MSFPRSSRLQLSSNFPRLPPLIQYIILLLTILIGTVLLKGVLSDWVLRSEGYLVKVDRPSISVEVRANKDVVVPFLIRNISYDAISILAAETSCDCTSAIDLPITIPKGEGRILSFRVTTEPQQAGQHVSRYIKLLLDKPSPEIRLKIDVNID